MCVEERGRTFVAEVVHQDDLCDEPRRGAVEDAVDGPQQRRPALVVEGDDDAGVGQLLRVQLLFTAAHKPSVSGWVSCLGGGFRVHRLLVIAYSFDL